MYRKFDDIIWGGSLLGCVAAVLRSRSGRRVAIVERRGFLGCDITGTLRLYEELKPLSEIPDLKELWELLTKAGGNALSAGKEGNAGQGGSALSAGEEGNAGQGGNALSAKQTDSALQAGEMKRRLLDWVEENGVEVFFALEPCAVLLDREERAPGGLLLGGKWGFFLLEGSCIIDAGQTACVKRMLDGGAWKHGTEASMVLGLTAQRKELNIPEAAGLTGLVKRLEDKWPGLTPEEKLGAEGITYRLWYGKELSYLEADYPVEAEESMADLYLKGQEALLRSLKLIQRLCPSARIQPQLLAYEPFTGRKPLAEALIEEGGLMERWITSHILRVSLPEDGWEEAHFRNRAMVLPLSAFEKMEWDPYEKRLPFQKLLYKEAAKLPVLLSCEVAVAGGGTAGVAAAAGSAREGAHTAVVESCYGFGGTQTYGGIAGYYFGHRQGFANQQKKCMEEYGLEASCTGRLLWYSHSLAKEGVCLYNGATVCAVVKEADTITGMVVVRDGSLGMIKAGIVIDATGDGDLMEFAEIPFQLGAQGSGNVQDGGMQHYGGYGYNLDAIYQSKYQEVLRGIRMGHRLGGGIDFSPVLTPREGRLFEGEYTLDMRDVLLHGSFPDTIALAYTDNDPHGEMSSLLSYMGITPYHGEAVRVEIPYRCCIPRGVRGMLAASKSISATQDAAAYLRMAADVQNRAYAIGTAGAMAALGKCDVRDIPLEQLQKTMRHMQILEHVSGHPTGEGKGQEREIPVPSLEGEERQRLICGLKEEKRECLGRVLCLPGEVIVPVLKEEFAKEPDSMVLGMALAWFGEGEGLGLLKLCLKNLAEKEDIEAYDDRNLIKPGNNLGGVMEEPGDYWRINQLLIVLGLRQEKAVQEEVRKLLDRFTGGGAAIRRDNPYVARRWDLHRIPHFDRLRSLLFYVNRVPSAELGRSLRQLAQREQLTGFLGDEEIYSYHNRDAEDQCVGRQYQSACMELSIGEALWKCMDGMGKEILERGLTDVHYILRRRAQIAYSCKPARLS